MERWKLEYFSSKAYTTSTRSYCLIWYSWICQYWSFINWNKSDRWSMPYYEKKKKNARRIFYNCSNYHWLKKERRRLFQMIFTKKIFSNLTWNTQKGSAPSMKRSWFEWSSKVYFWRKLLFFNKTWFSIIFVYFRHLFGNALVNIWFHQYLMSLKANYSVIVNATNIIMKFFLKEETQSNEKSDKYNQYYRNPYTRAS